MPFNDHLHCNQNNNLIKKKHEGNDFEPLCDGTQCATQLCKGATLLRTQALFYWWLQTASSDTPWRHDDGPPAAGGVWCVPLPLGGAWAAAASQRGLSFSDTEKDTACDASHSNARTQRPGFLLNKATQSWRGVITIFIFIFIYSYSSTFFVELFFYFLELLIFFKSQFWALSSNKSPPL